MLAEGQHARRRLMPDSYAIIINHYSLFGNVKAKLAAAKVPAFSKGGV
jgi:hypothetical protein